MPQTASTYNAARPFDINFKESRLKKAARIIAQLPPGHFLDLGCSTGEWALYWKTRGWSVKGVDVNPEAAQTATQRGVEAGCCDLNTAALPHASASQDFIFAGEVIEHIVDTDHFLGEVVRCLKPGGHLLLTTPNLASFENRVRLLLGRYPRWLDHRLAGCGHVRGYTPAVLKQQLEAHGLQVLRRTGNWVPFLPQAWLDDVRCPWLAFTGGLFPNLAMDIIVLAQKK